MKREEPSKRESKICKMCKNEYEKLYQNNTCKNCLVASFKKVIKFVDYYRSGQKNVCFWLFSVFLTVTYVFLA